MERQRTDLDTALAALRAKIETQTAQLEQRRGELKEEAEALQASLAALAPHLTEVAEEQEQLAGQRREWQAADASLRPVEQLKEAVQTAIGQVRERLSDLERQAQRRAEMEEALAEYDTVKAQADLLDQSEQALQSARDAVTALETERKTLRRDRKQAQGGLCPFLKEPCKNVEGGNLEEHFAARITEVEAQLASARVRVEDREEAVATARAAHDCQLQLDAERQRLRDLEGDRARLVESAFTVLEGVEVDTGPEGLDAAMAALGEQGGEVATEAERAKEAAGTVWPDGERAAESLPAIADGLAALRDALEGFLKPAQAVRTRQDQRLTEAEASLRERQSRLDTERKHLEKTQKQNARNQGRLDQAEAELATEQEELARKEQERVSELERKRQTLATKQAEQARETAALQLLQFLREMLRTAGEPIAEVYLQYLQAEATRLYRLLSEENVEIVWERDYELKLRDAEQERTFRQLSGGEQMSAAIAVRLALLKQFSGVNMGFFDEPTANLDEGRRFNLAQAIGNLREDMGTWFSQIFLVSHDDAFQAVTENVVELSKESGTGSGLQPAYALT